MLFTGEQNVKYQPQKGLGRAWHTQMPEGKSKHPTSSLQRGTVTPPAHPTSTGGMRNGVSTPGCRNKCRALKRPGIHGPCICNLQIPQVLHQNQQKSYHSNRANLQLHAYNIEPTNFNYH